MENGQHQYLQKKDVVDLTRAPAEFWGSRGAETNDRLKMPVPQKKLEVRLLKYWNERRIRYGDCINASLTGPANLHVIVSKLGGVS
jgi:hypothetical protein